MATKDSQTRQMGNTHKTLTHYKGRNVRSTPVKVDYFRAATIITIIAFCLAYWFFVIRYLLELLG